MKLWAGRFTKQTDEKVNDFNSSIRFDARMYREDITGSIAHATMLLSLIHILLRPGYETLRYAPGTRPVLFPAYA